MQALGILIDYLEVPGFQPAPEQTLAFQSWILKLAPGSEGHLAIWEASPDGSGYRQGADYAISVYYGQLALCAQYNEPSMQLPKFNQKIAVSKGVYQGDSVTAVRYPAPGHMTGWIITAADYNGDINSLLVDHYFHLAFCRPDILPYLALPNGYRFEGAGRSFKVYYTGRR